jgi:hypothetical protein
MKIQSRFKSAYILVVCAMLGAVLACGLPIAAKPAQPREMETLTAVSVKPIPTETDPPIAESQPTSVPPTVAPEAPRPTETEPPTPRPTETELPTIVAVTPRPTETEPPTPGPTGTQEQAITPPPARRSSSLIAHYPLSNDAYDVTGNNLPMNLENAPFQNGGVYCNGVYKLSGKTDYYFVGTSPLQNFNFSSFSIMASFNAASYRKMPVFVGGHSARWIAFYLNEDGSVNLMYNNNNYQNCGGKYGLNVWHEALITYDGQTARLYLDQQFRCSADFKSSAKSSDTDVSTTNFSNGAVFQGFLRDLKIYNNVLTP